MVSRSVYQGTASTVTIGQCVPPAVSCAAGSQATNTGAFPVVGSTNNVWNNDLVDGSFGVTSPIFLDQITTGGNPVGAPINVSAVAPLPIVTSFSSKSELALNLSTDGLYITFMGYNTSINQLDISNSNTPGVFDATNPVTASVYREVARINAAGVIDITQTNAYSGNNGRSAIYAATPNLFYTAGNDNNGTTATAANLVSATGVQVFPPGAALATPVQAGVFPTIGTDKPGKDNNFRGLTIFNNNLYVTKGSGSNGIDTVYQVGTGLPPSTGGTTITVLTGFPTALAKTAGINNIYPFGIWFANSTTLYVADEGDGKVADAGISTLAGLQKWSLVNGSWTLDYVLQNGLNLGVQYGVANYPSSLNPATAGLRNLTGRVNADGTATIWAVTSTVSANGDQGADPNLLVTITDNLANTSSAAAAGEQFTVIKAAGYGEVLRGVSFTPGSTAPVAPGSVVVTSSALVRSRATGYYNGTLTITNNSSSVLSGSAVVALTSLPQGVTLLNASGTSNGSPTVAFPQSTLNPGQSQSVAISFTDPSNVLITATPVVVTP